MENFSDNPADYADPSQAIPSKNVPPRFDLSADGLFSYIGREMFMGPEKSHILAVLTCLRLVRKKELDVYLPDCRAVLQQPLKYLRNALLFAFADLSSSGYRECDGIETFASGTNKVDCASS